MERKVGKIENGFNNWLGDGREQIITMDDGKRYKIVNGFNNWMGEGRQKEIIEIDSTPKYSDRDFITNPVTKKESILAELKLILFLIGLPTIVIGGIFLISNLLTS